ncbi:MAG: ATP-binding cassette domain-containing protein, partial [Fervidobacterium sp.]
MTIKNFKIFINNDKLIDIEYFSFQKGFIYSIFGRSGIGKSTLLKGIGSLTEYQGEIFIGDSIIGKDLNVRESRKRVHYVRQEPRFLSGTGIDNLKYIFKLNENRNMRFDEDLAYMFADKLNIERELFYKDVKNLSGGERQRLSLIRSLIIQPEFILLDEPSSALDIHTEELLIKLLHEIKVEIGVIVVSHSTNFIVNSDKKLLLSDKKINFLDYEVNEDLIKKIIEE